MTFGQQLQSLRKEKGYSQEQLAQQLYVTRQSVSLWENDRSLPSVDLLLKLSQIFGISVDKLLGKEDEPEAPMSECFILTEKKDIQRASRFWYCSTVTLLFASACALFFHTMLSIHINPAVYQNLPYMLSAAELFVNYAAAGALALTAVLLLSLRLRQRKRVRLFAQMLSGKICFFRDNLILCDKNGSPTVFFYANLRSVYDYDRYLMITLPNKQTIILDKTAADEKLGSVIRLLSENKFYRKKHISLNTDHHALIRQVLHNVLFVAVITTTISSHTLTIMLRTNNALPLRLQWFMFVLPWVLAAAVLVTGIVACVRKIRAKRLIFAGASSLAFLLVLFIVNNCLFAIYDFNRRALPAEEFLEVMQAHHFTVTETNTDNPDNFLWECYRAVSEDGNIEIKFMHFKEEMRWTSVRSARGAYDRLCSQEMAKTNNDNLSVWLDLYINAYRVTQCVNGHYSYLSLNRYTVICVSTTKDYVGETESVLSDYQLHLPY